MMGDLTRIVAKAYAAVKRDRAEPDRTAIGPFFKDQPKPDMMSLVGAPSVRFLESELLLLPVVIKGADRRIVVWPVKRHTADDLDTRTQRNWIGRKPAGRMHRGKDIFLAADKSNIECVSWNATGSKRQHRQGSKAGLMFVMGPQRGKEDVRQQDIADR